MPLLLDLLPKHVKIIDSGEAVAKQTKAILAKNNLLNTETIISNNLFYSNGNPEVIKSLIGTKYATEHLDF